MEDINLLEEAFRNMVNGQKPINFLDLIGSTLVEFKVKDFPETNRCIRLYFQKPGDEKRYYVNMEVKI